ncbi:MAG: hypothetical protein EKK37_16055 [Sphingobacteriales bacterium]|nr:MAG: hypothetical protein EKK37_16055 [Sphingobacteriales bacterium]
MKKTTAIILSMLVILVFSACHHHRHYGFKTYFWTSSRDAENEELYINGRYIGQLPLLKEAPDDNNGLKSEALFVHLPSGRYKVIIRDNDGDVKFRETLRLHIGGGDKTIAASGENEEYRSLRIVEGDELIEEILK